MNFPIEYSFVEALKDYKEPLSPLKSIRDFKHNRGTIMTVVCGTAIFFSSLPFLRALGVSLLTLNAAVLPEFCYYSTKNVDPYKNRAELRLKNLCSSLRTIDVDTDQSLIKNSKVIDKVHKLKLNKKKIPQLVSIHHILVPSYDSLGNEKEVSIYQTHSLGSKEYILSREAQLRNRKKVPVSNAA